jgi:four helix bundle protein
MARINRFEEIEAWQTGRILTRRIYEITNEGAFTRDFGLRDQMRRAAVSVMSNIAEGFESRTNKLFVEYLGRAKTSSGELRAQTYVALDAGYLDQPTFDELFDLKDKCSRQLSRFMTYLQSQSRQETNV